MLAGKALLTLNSSLEMQKISNEGIVFLIILGCLAVVFIGYGLYSLAHGTDDDAYPSPPPEQAAYMRELRMRNLMALKYEARRRDTTY